MTNERYVITINTVKSPFAAALATLVGADMLKHLLARLPNPMKMRIATLLIVGNPRLIIISRGLPTLSYVALYVCRVVAS